MPWVWLHGHLVTQQVCYTVEWSLLTCVISDKLGIFRHSDCQQLKQDLAEARERIRVADAEMRQVFVLDDMVYCFTDVHSSHTARCIRFLA